jgi:predicted phage baseplate assembly protein
MSDLVCRTDGRRAAIRAAAHLNGVDEVEVSDDGRMLTVTFLGPAPDGITPGNVRIDGGRRVTGIVAVDVSVQRADDPELDDRLHVTVDRPGDSTPYRLSIVEADPAGRPGTVPYPGFDQRYYGAEFRFWPQRGTPVDCAEPCHPDRCGCDDETAAEGPAAPVIDYTARDYDTVRRLLLDRLALTIPGWVERNEADLGVTLVEMLAYTADQISYHQDAVATEAYLDTARRRVSVRRHARLVDYRMHDGCNARTVVVLEVTAPVTLHHGRFRFAAVQPHPRHPRDAYPIGTVIGEGDLPELDEHGLVEVFEPLDRRPVRLLPQHHTIRFWTWGDGQCVLRRGATSATLRDEWAGDGRGRRLDLSPGDLLVLEEVRGPRSGDAGDADPTHRQAVRLASVTPAVDGLAGQPVLEVTWAEADALRFPLVLSAATGPHRTPVGEVSVARGNAVPVDHGRSLAFCGGAPERVSARRPVLAQWPVTQAVPYPEPRHVAAGQAARLAGIPARVLARLAELWRSACDHNGLTDAEAAELAVLFGLAHLERVELRAQPQRALRELLHRAETLLAAKRRRLEVLTARARAGTVLSGHVAEEIAQGWGRAYAEGLDPDHPVLRGPAAALAADPRHALPAVRVHDGEHTWWPRRDLLDSGPHDRHFVGELTDDGRLALRFGDGSCPPARLRHPPGNGATPRPGSDLEIGYRVGGGVAGNVGAGAIRHLVLCRDPDEPDRGPPPVVGVRNPLPAAGGTEPEPVEHVRRIAPLDIRRRRLRAITAGDYAELAAGLPGVQRAAAEIRWTGSGQEVHVAVDARRTGTPSPRLLDGVADALEAYRRIGHDLVVEPARPVPLDIVVEVCAEPGHRHGRIVAELYRVLLASFAPDALSFGEPVRVSRLVALAASVTGVRSARVTRLRHRFAAADAGQAAAGLLRLGRLEIARCDNDPARPEHGRLRIDLTEGGE